VAQVALDAWSLAYGDRDVCVTRPNSGPPEILFQQGSNKQTAAIYSNEEDTTT